jgi:hypothetical protein
MTHNITYSSTEPINYLTCMILYYLQYLHLCKCCNLEYIRLYYISIGGDGKQEY